MDSEERGASPHSWFFLKMPQTSVASSSSAPEYTRVALPPEEDEGLPTYEEAMAMMNS